MRTGLRIIKVEQIARGYKAGEKQGKDSPRVAQQAQGWRAENLEWWALVCGHCQNKTKKLLISFLILKATYTLWKL